MSSPSSPGRSLFIVECMVQCVPAEWISVVVSWHVFLWVRHIPCNFGFELQINLRRCWMVNDGRASPKPHVSTNSSGQNCFKSKKRHASPKCCELVLFLRALLDRPGSNELQALAIDRARHAEEVRGSMLDDVARILLRGQQKTEN